MDENPQQTVDEWNDKNSIGTQIVYYRGEVGENGKQAVTESGALVLGHHTPVVKVSGESGFIALSHVEKETTNDESN